MFDTLTGKFQDLVGSLTSKKLTESNISDAVRETRLALLEADVNYSVASTFVKRVKEKALGETLLKSIKPSQQFIKILHDELTALMGGEEATLKLDKKPSIIMLCGLQGSGKTTHCVKLGSYLKKKNKKVLLAACDLQRLAAVDQLKKLASEAHLTVFSLDEKSPVKVAKKALKKAQEEKYDVLIVDTAGRLHVDETLMDELLDIKNVLQPDEVLFVANATTGQDAVKTAFEFDKKVAITGTILTMLDGNARAGAAISITEITKKPLKFEGIGEKIDDLQVFHPKSMADRILGMGDVINLVKKAEENISEEESKSLQKKLKKATFNYEDYLKQMGMLKKMGSFKSLLKMIPGASAFSDFDMPEGKLKKIEAIIMSMTLNERQETVGLGFSRRKRLASGSGCTIDEVNRMVKSFKRIKQMLKKMPTKGGLKNFAPNMKQLKSQFGGNLWH
jgi:signal recognition particle subunit SRP54